jgi:hypothetical protein
MSDNPTYLSSHFSIRQSRISLVRHELPVIGGLNTGEELTKLISPPAHFDNDASAVVIERLIIHDREVAREAQRWVSGERGPLVEDIAELAGADLTNYVTEAVRIGAHALSVTGQAQEAQALERMLKDVGDKTAHSTAKAAELTARAVRDASEAVMTAARDARIAITEADTQSRKEFTTAVAAAKQDLNTELRRIFAGESPELVERLQPILDKFGAGLDAKVSAGTTELLTKAAKQFDPSDPASPMAKHAAELTARQEQLTQQLTSQHAELTSKIEEMSTALRIQEATTALTKVTPIKGNSYASQAHAVMVGIAAGLGDDYTDTSSTTGRLPRCKKGDGVLSVNDGAARVVIEMTDSARTGWTEYFGEAERNRDAVASLGLVRTIDQNGWPDHPRHRCPAGRAGLRPRQRRPRPPAYRRHAPTDDGHRHIEPQGCPPGRHGRGEDRRGAQPAGEDRLGQEAVRHDPEIRDEDRQ